MNLKNRQDKYKIYKKVDHKAKTIVEISFFDRNESSILES